MKFEKVSISLEDDLLAVIDAHCEETRKDRSEFIREGVRDALGTLGKLPGTALESLLSEARATAELAPIDDIRQALAAIRLKASEKKRRVGKARAVA